MCGAGLGFWLLREIGYRTGLQWEGAAVGLFLGALTGWLIAADRMHRIAVGAIVGSLFWTVFTGGDACAGGPLIPFFGAWIGAGLSAIPRPVFFAACSAILGIVVSRYLDELLFPNEVTGRLDIIGFTLGVAAWVIIHSRHEETCSIERNPPDSEPLT